jgi:hypothetical protein
MDVKAEFRRVFERLDPVGLECGDYDTALNDLVELAEGHASEMGEYHHAINSQQNEASLEELAIRVHLIMEESERWTGDPVKRAAFVARALHGTFDVQRRPGT